jgi:hypothetical protein
MAKSRESEWIGGLVSPPAYVTDRDEPYRVQIALWLERPADVIVGYELIPPGDPLPVFTRALRRAIQQPMAGRPRRPARVRVADPALAAAAREVLGQHTPLTVAPTPELDEVMATFHELAGEPNDEVSYLEKGRIDAGVVAAFFRSARLLFQVAPWQTADDDDILHMDIPALGVRGACVSIIGNLGESLGLIVFPSLKGYQSFIDAADAAEADGRKPRNIGTGWLSLNFERGADLPAGLRREIAAHAWPVAGTEAYPVAMNIDPDLVPRPLVTRDYRVLEACARAVAAFYVQHRGQFGTGNTPPVSESWFDQDGLEVRLTMPYEAHVMFAPAEPERPPRPRVGRNEPCPCGSGRKYKKCCLAADQQRGRREREQHRVHERDDHWVALLAQYAFERFAAKFQRCYRDFEGPEASLQLAAPWSVYGFPVQGRPVVDWFLEERGQPIPAADRVWLEAQRAAWLSLWEVTAVVPGERLALRDFLTGEARDVKESTASKVLVTHDVVLARIVDFQGTSLICGLHPRFLPPRCADLALRQAQAKLRRKSAVPAERLRDGKIGRHLIRTWEDCVAAYDEERAQPRKLHNTDGDPFLLTIDHFDLAAGNAAELEARLAALPGVDAPPEESRDEQPRDFVFLRPGGPAATQGGSTVIGRAWVERSRLHVETNSIQRADALRGRLESELGGAIRHRAREHSDPLSPAAAPQGAAPPELPPEAREVMLEYKREYYARWPDEPVPALGGKTPRQAARSKKGRAELDLLLREIENMERRAQGEDAFDFTPLREVLGLKTGP